MARIIMKSPYLKPNSGGRKHRGNYAKYIATREGVEIAEDTTKHLHATVKQEALIRQLLKDFPDSTDFHEYGDYKGNPTRENATELINLAGNYIGWIILIPFFCAVPFALDGIMIGATESRVMRNAMFVAAAAFFALHFGLYPLIGNNALWAAFTLYMLLRGMCQYLMTNRLGTLYAKAEV